MIALRRGALGGRLGEGLQVPLVGGVVDHVSQSTLGLSVLNAEDADEGNDGSDERQEVDRLAQHFSNLFLPDCCGLNNVSDVLCQWPAGGGMVECIR